MGGGIGCCLPSKSPTENDLLLIYKNNHLHDTCSQLLWWWQLAWPYIIVVLEWRMGEQRAAVALTIITERHQHHPSRMRSRIHTTLPWSRRQRTTSTLPFKHAQCNTPSTICQYGSVGQKKKGGGVKEARKAREYYTYLRIHTYIYVYTYIYTYAHTHTHTHTHKYIYIYIYDMI
jgi:hypothetical protein